MSTSRFILKFSLLGFVPLTCVLLTTLGCSDDDGADGGGGSSTAGSSSSTAGSSAAGSPGAGGSSTATCRTGEPVAPDAAFTELAGTYTFRLLTSGCTVAGTVIEPMQDYAVEVTETPRAIRITVGATPLEFTWDGTGDVVCESDTVRAIEIDGHDSLARASFIGDTPSALVVGTCSGTLK